MAPLRYSSWALLVDQRTDPLAADLQNLAARLLGLNDGVAVFHMLHHRLFAIHVLLRLQSIDGDALVPVVGRADQDRIDIGTRQNLFVIPGSEHIAPVDFFHVFQPSVVAVARRDNLGQSGGGGTLGVRLPHPSATDQGDLNLIVGTCNGPASAKPPVRT